ncbi:hypothetical protein Lspi_0158 [Legionella spiritensis]|uniref:Uncharacterized protein n=1 Tax=Legionella spiritensis TaxID=452 RepID=A0A0W0ZAK4_LEGSP|nr:hypothetical protein Lspi_0158 [Legionella spiritensis]SNV44215.1 Uncharacterised protein [Legionella spiritensis]
MRENVPNWHIKPAIEPQASLRATAFSQKWCEEKLVRRAYALPSDVSFNGRPQTQALFKS